MPFSAFGKGILFTEHSLKRLEERTERIYMSMLQKGTKAAIQEEPTAADIAQTLICHSMLEYGRWLQFYYLNVVTGMFVLERYDDVFIVKTFLTEDLLQREIQWFKPLLGPEVGINAHGFFPCFKDFVDHDCIEVEKPPFLPPWFMEEDEDDEV